jgi:UDP-2,3-diacylglucosamine pyrophosphatase LpxH
VNQVNSSELSFWECRMEDLNIRRFKTLFFSDVHLGSKQSQAGLLLNFLKHHDADKIYLVGDIVDGWRLRRAWHWPQEHSDIVQKILRKARKGAHVIYIAGNHDEFLREFQGQHFGGIEVKDRDVHEATDGRKYLVIHGDQFDIVVQNYRKIAYLGDWAYDTAMAINVAMNRLRSLFGLPYWSFSSWAKVRVKEAVKFISAFRAVVTEEAQRSNVDGIICGHIHHPEINAIDGMIYVNTGDWVESCSAVGENEDGSLELVFWQRLKVTGPPLVNAQLTVSGQTRAA